MTDGRKAGLQTLIAFAGRRAAMFARRDARAVPAPVRRALGTGRPPPSLTAAPPAGFAAQRAGPRPGALRWLRAVTASPSLFKDYLQADRTVVPGSSQLAREHRPGGGRQAVRTFPRR